MNRWRCARQVCRGTWNDSVQRPEFLASVLFVLLFCTFDSIIIMQGWLGEVGRVAVGELVVNIFYHPFTVFLIIGGLYIFLMRAPFLARTDAVFLPRVGRMSWIWGKLMFVLEYITVIFLAYVVVIILFLFSYLDFTQWRDWSACVLDFPFSLGKSIYEATTPLGALITTVSLAYLLLLSTTLLIMLLNLCFGRLVSLLSVSIICLSGVMLDEIAPRLARWSLALQGTLVYHQFAGKDNIPAGPGTRLPTLGESYIVFIVLCALLLGLILWRVKRYDFQTYEKGMH